MLHFGYYNDIFASNVLMGGRAYYKQRVSSSAFSDYPELFFNHVNFFVYYLVSACFWWYPTLQLLCKSSDALVLQQFLLFIACLHFFASDLKSRTVGVFRKPQHSFCSPHLVNSIRLVHTNSLSTQPTFA